VNADPPCSPSDRLKSIVMTFLHETDRQKESEQNPIQHMLIGPGIGMLNDLYIIYICVLNS